MSSHEGRASSITNYCGSVAILRRPRVIWVLYDAILAIELSRGNKSMTSADDVDHVVGK